MNSNQFEMSVCVNGRPIREYGHRGLTFVEGRKNQHYTIKFRNNTAKRVLAVISVDGVSVVDGSPADEKSRGYIVPAYSSAEIKGWRTSKRETHKFVFDTKKRAYSSQTQKEETNCGVIAVKVFDEKISSILWSALHVPNNILRIFQDQHHHYHHHHYPPPTPAPITPLWTPMTPMCGTAGGEATYGCCTDTNSASLRGEVKAMNMTSPGVSTREEDHSGLMFASAMAPKEQENPDFNLGTGWGAAVVDEVDEDNFERALELACFSIYYSDSEGLKAAGIEVDKKPAISPSVLPRGFGGFCKPPVVTSP